MRAQYLMDVNEQIEEARRHMSFLFEEGHEIFFSESFWSARESLASNLYVDASKKFSKIIPEISLGQSS